MSLFSAITCKSCFKFTYRVLLCNFFALLMICSLSFVVTSCGFGHWSAKLWEGSYTRNSGDLPVYETWKIKVDNDGSCAAINTGSGSFNYTHEYTGSWVPISDDIIKVELESEPYTENVTRSNAERDKMINGARTRSERREAYKNAYSSTYRTSRHVQTLYIRKDGAVSFSESGLDNPVFRCK